MKPYVAVGLPRRSKPTSILLYGHKVHSSKGVCTIEPVANVSSLLNHSFNNILSCVINNYEDGMPLTHLAFLHDDIDAEAGWVDVLWQEMEAVGADFISAYVPIKDDRALTSMAQYENDPWDFDRFTLRQLATMPDTFTQDDVPWNLYLNTGCCLLKLREPWVSQPDKFTFHTKEKISRGKDGKWIASVISEDWLFTDAIRKAGGRLAATRKVRLSHQGEHDYRNDTIWGRWHRDEAYASRHGEGNEESQIPSGRDLQAERTGAVTAV